MQVEEFLADHSDRKSLTREPHLPMTVHPSLYWVLEPEKEGEERKIKERD